MIRKYEVISYDVWGNARDVWGNARDVWGNARDVWGNARDVFEVNAAYSTGRVVEIDPDATD